MVNPIKVVENVVQLAPKAASAVLDAVTDAAPKAAEKAADTSGELLRAYHGVKPGKLFASFSDFVTDFKTRLAAYSEDLPKDLVKSLTAKIDNHDFSLTKTVSDYYSGLNKCKTLDEVRKMYPEIILPDKTPRQMVTEEIKTYIPQKTVEAVRNLTTRDAQDKFFNKFFDDMLSEQVKTSEIYPDILKIRDEIKAEILSGEFKGVEKLQHNGFAGSTYKYGNSPKKNMLARLISDDYENIMLDILRQNYIDGKSIVAIKVQTPEYLLSAQNIRRRHPFSILDQKFKAFLESAEKSAAQFKDLKNLDAREISSRVMTETWTKSRLRADLSNETKKGKDWSLVKRIWHKSMFPDSNYYQTDKLIDGYLLTMFKNGKRSVDMANPLLKYIDAGSMDKKKISLLKRLYHDVKELDMDTRTLNSQAFKDFKAKFDIEGMKKTIEDLENHYKNAFFKRFWTDDRKARFTQALNANRELAKENIEISDKILTDAMNSVFSIE